MCSLKINNPYLEFSDSSALNNGTQKRFELRGPVTRLGRERGIEVEVEAGAAAVSRLHAEIRCQNEAYILTDMGSFNGTFLNGRRIAGPKVLNDGDSIQLGPGGPTISFRSAPTNLPRVESRQNFEESGKLSDASSDSRKPAAGHVSGLQSQIFIQKEFDDRKRLTVGRSEECDIRLDGLLISNNHARISNDGSILTIEDLNSTNGTYVNGQRITSHKVMRNDLIQIGAFLLEVSDDEGVTVFDTRAKTRIDVVKISKEVPDHSGSGTVRLLDDICLSIPPNEFVGLIGPSGAGKSTLMDALNGMRPASSGRVLVNNLDLYQHLEFLKQSIGYVPQDDIIHRELSVYQTLYYVARLRLSGDISPKEIDQVVSEVLDVTGLLERRNVPISQLSGGQRKRVSIAVELITKPSVIFLDEPTSGLDPATEEKVMKLFRQIAESGRTIILTTHAMENVRLFDKIVVLMRGKLVFYGKPQEALAHVGAETFTDLYNRLEAPVEKRLKQTNGSTRRDQVASDVAEQWKQRFIQTKQYRENVEAPLRAVPATPYAKAPTRQRGAIHDWWRQTVTLSRRYFEVLGADKFNLLILFCQAPIVALLTYLVVGAEAPRDFIYFILALVALWFGISVSAREIIRERPVFKRERMVNLRLLPYLGSKIVVLLFIVSVQCLLLLGTLKLLVLADVMSVPGPFGGMFQLLVMILTGLVGITIGLFVSALVKTSEMATSLVPLILIPQILFCGLVGVPTGISKLVGVVMPATWSLDEMKRLSQLDVLRGKDESAQPSPGNAGRGLYKQIERENDQRLDDARRQINDYSEKVQTNVDDLRARLIERQRGVGAGERAGSAATTMPLRSPPEIPSAVKVPSNLANYIDFLHPWGSHQVDIGVLTGMFIIIFAATIVILRSQDVA